MPRIPVDSRKPHLTAWIFLVLFGMPRALLRSVSGGGRVVLAFILPYYRKYNTVYEPLFLLSKADIAN